MLEPLRAIERERIATRSREATEARDAHDLIERQIEGIKKRAEKGAGPKEREEIAALREQLASIDPASLVVPRLLEDDATPEALASSMAESGGCMSIIADEAAIFAHVVGAYSRAPNIDLLLKAYDGGSVRIIRRGRREEIERPALTISVLVQPTVIDGLAETAFARRGGLARLRFFAPDCRIGYRNRARLAAPPRRLADAYERNVRALADRWLDGELAMMRLSDEADRRFNEWWSETEVQRRPGGSLTGSPRFMEWNGKDGEPLRLAGLLHVVHGFDQRTEVSVEQVDRAIAVHEVITEHARRVLDGTPGLSGVQRFADRIVRWLRSPARDQPEIVTVRSAMRQTSRPREEVVAALDLLETLGYVRATEGPRRDSVRYEVNPMLLEEAT